MLITCCLLAADGVLQISGKRKLTSGKMEDKENGKTPAQLKDELSGLLTVTHARDSAAWDDDLVRPDARTSYRLRRHQGGSASGPCSRPPDTPYPTVPTAVPQSTLPYASQRI
jgi:hypothetical protein